MRDIHDIKPGMPVVCSEGGQFAVVDHLDGEDMVKLRKDKQGLHHYIPTSWVDRIDDEVHVDRPGDQAMQEWLTEAPQRMQWQESETGSSH